MPKTRPPYAPEFRRQMVELVRAGRDPAGLAREFEPSAQAIRNWVLQADLAEGRRGAKPTVADGTLTAAEREGLARLWRALPRSRIGPRPMVRPRDRGDPARVFRFMSANRAEFPIARMARARRAQGGLPRPGQAPALRPCPSRRRAAAADPGRPRQLAADLWRAARSRRCEAALRTAPEVSDTGASGSRG